MSKVLASFLVISFVSMSAFGGCTKERPLKVFVLAGTSNMLSGTAKIDKVPEDLRQPLKEVLVYAELGAAPNGANACLRARS